jgi:hypothetical protein
MSGIEPLLAAEVVPAVAGAAEAATGTEAALASLEAAQAASAMEAASAAASAANAVNPYIMPTAYKSASAATSAANAINPFIMSTADKAASAAASAANAVNPYIMSTADKAALLGNAGYGPAMSGFQTSVFDTTLGLTGSPQIASLLAGSERMAANLGPAALLQAMRPRQQTSVAAQIRRPQAAMNPVALMIEAQKRKRRPLSLL